MQLRREASIGVGALIGLQVLLSMLGIALLMRMAPTIYRTLNENVQSEEAVETMLASLASTPIDPMRTTLPEAFERGFQRASNNVTTEEETPALQSIRANALFAFRGDRQARERLVHALANLSGANRRVMQEEHLMTKKLALAGAWSAGLLGATALALGIIVFRRIRTRLELPLVELQRTMQRFRAGNVQSRCSTKDGPQELRQVATSINHLLDRLLSEGARRKDQTEHRGEEALRATANFLADRIEHPLLVTDKSGARVLSNRAALELGLALPSFNPNAADQLEGWVGESIRGSEFRLWTPADESEQTTPDA